ncbi:Sporulation and spore germination [Acididesulfobacillus acetoxydans]|uniref:Sporulation and spore germination n=1 Tax=Acididesulfobacillus acetoxydans TaxID=1561005 RepID=A0A8S0WKP5_9FIRM|nr:GerMN domain-containing protein [Acididesulfobacillus acetoxydans]CAA7599514.1 Sporulation and spore germination [Acididesulfobacillus acetoxydans]CEJ08683.1 Sporulation and spore germination [Acididesulfobacillus acetoxydans]
MKKDHPQRSLYRKGICGLWVVALSALLISGCSTLDTMLQRGGDSAGVLGGAGGGGTTGTVSQTPAAVGAGKNIVLYFADTSGRYLVKEERTVPNTLSMARETVNQWLKGPGAQGGGSQAAAPPGTALKDIAIKNGCAIVDFNRAFKSSFAKVTPEVTLYALADTLTQFPSIQDVQVWVEGKPLGSLGNVSTSDLKFNGSLVKPGSASNSSSPPSGQTNPGDKAGSMSGSTMSGAGGMGSAMTGTGGSGGGMSGAGSPSSQGGSGGSNGAGGSGLNGAGGAGSGAGNSGQSNLSPSALNLFSTPASST